ncbi:helix-turn-helix domain-containing protein [Amedibacillus dolichus]|uniref:DNA-binding helix-turn-helix protein n=1 Tax=Amedibacillus dolichus DSM 3991 TaxID=428127 RepID=A8RC42_9FIRM|nr:helix-turn-helix transcriptional regulator [Amedibacillus dolichus]EDP11342.1 DNA-binding helix-turn-helix protein [Amedibacillus dolichus DSM 3991]
MLAENLKKLRKQKEQKEHRRISKSNVSKELGLDLSAYGKWENGDRNPDMFSLIKLANYFDVSIDYLLDNEKSTPLCDEVLEINKAMEKVNQEDRQRMVETLKAAFPYAFDDYLWAMNVLQQNDYVMYNSIKAGNSELSKQDIIRIANELKK